ncbi:MAG: DUF4956 domain-containing protein [Clostridia bacterium]|nr:DUF4956 domain-containing protein [Clostridia bacterium]
MFESILSSTTGTLSVSTSLICMGTSLVLGLAIALVHMWTSKYSKSFVISLAILPALVQVVMMMVNGNLGTSVAILGAFGLIRFRSMPGTAKEIVSVFFAMAIGLATGMGHVLFATYVTAIISILIVILSKTKFGEKNNDEKRLKIILPEELDYNEIFKDIFENYTKSCRTEKVKTINMGSMYELTYNVVLKDQSKEKEFIDKLRVRNGNLAISMQRVEEGLGEL